MKLVCRVCEQKGVKVILEASGQAEQHFKREHPFLWAHIKVNMHRKWLN